MKRLLPTLAYTGLLISLWVIDVSVIILLRDGGGSLTNGFWAVDAGRAYHVGLYGAVLSALALAYRAR